MAYVAETVRLPLSLYLVLAGFNGLRWRGAMRTIGDFVEGGSTLLAIRQAPRCLRWSYSNACATVHLCTMQWMTFRLSMQVFPAALMRREREIAQRVDVILASSSALKSRWMDFHKDVRLVHNALVCRLFGQWDQHRYLPRKRSSAMSGPLRLGLTGTWYPPWQRLDRTVQSV